MGSSMSRALSHRALLTSRVRRSHQRRGSPRRNRVPQTSHRVIGRLSRMRLTAVGGTRAVATAALVCLGLVVGPAMFASSTNVWSAALAGSSCARAAGVQQVGLHQAGVQQVGLAIDFGTVDGGSVAVQIHCVSIARGGTGFDVLKNDGHAFRLNSAGLVCAIDGFPATGCGDHRPTGYRYWSYWTVSDASPGTWTYATFGPASHRPVTGAVEGWRYVEGAGNPTDPAPRANPSSPCPVEQPTSVVPTSAPSEIQVTTTAPGANRGVTSGSNPTVESTVDSAGDSVTSMASVSTVPASESSSHNPSDDGFDSTTPIAANGGAGTGRPVAAIVVALAIAVLVVATVVRSKRRAQQ